MTLGSTGSKRTLTPAKSITENAVKKDRFQDSDYGRDTNEMKITTPTAFEEDEYTNKLISELSGEPKQTPFEHIDARLARIDTETGTRKDGEHTKEPPVEDNDSGPYKVYPDEYSAERGFLSSLSNDPYLNPAKFRNKVHDAREAIKSDNEYLANELSAIRGSNSPTTRQEGAINSDNELLDKEMAAIREEDNRIGDTLQGRQQVNADVRGKVTPAEKQKMKDAMISVPSNSTHKLIDRRGKDQTETEESEQRSLDKLSSLSLDNPGMSDDEIDKSTAELLNINIKADGKIVENTVSPVRTKESIFDTTNSFTNAPKNFPAAMIPVPSEALITSSVHTYNNSLEEPKASPPSSNIISVSFPANSSHATITENASRRDLHNSTTSETTSKVTKPSNKSSPVTGSRKSTSSPLYDRNTKTKNSGKRFAVNGLSEKQLEIMSYMFKNKKSMPTTHRGQLLTSSHHKRTMLPHPFKRGGIAGTDNPAFDNILSTYNSLDEDQRQKLLTMLKGGTNDAMDASLMKMKAASFSKQDLPALSTADLGLGGGMCII